MRAETFAAIVVCAFVYAVAATLLHVCGFDIWQHLKGMIP